MMTRHAARPWLSRLAVCVATLNPEAIRATTHLEAASALIKAQAVSMLHPLHNTAWACLAYRRTQVDDSELSQVGMHAWHVAYAGVTVHSWTNSKLPKLSQEDYGVLPACSFSSQAVRTVHYPTACILPFTGTN
jgi:hypothetical protein